VSELDPRLNVFRGDLADARLRGKIEALEFAEGKLARVGDPVLDLRNSPSPEASLDAQLLRGEDVRVFEDREGWAWVQALRDGYVGYAPANALLDGGRKPTHRVIVPRTFSYREPDMKKPMVHALSIGSEVCVTGYQETRGSRFAAIDDGTHIYELHLAPITDSAFEHYVDAALLLVGTPYLWGGTSAFGLDCSGLVQLAMRLGGRTVLRDTDMQARSIGEPFDPGENHEFMKRGDLVFWKGHVAIMLDRMEIVHASGSSMTVMRETLDQALRRIGPLYGPPTVFRRP
jgi:cell wall-associated NlpC family hydrolase